MSNKTAVFTIEDEATEDEPVNIDFNQPIQNPQNP